MISRVLKIRPYFTFLVTKSFIMYKGKNSN